MKDIWTKSKWRHNDLDHKLVEFMIPADKCWVHGVGRFLVRQNPEGLLVVDIEVDLPKSWYEMEVVRYHIPQAGVDAIENHDAPAVAPFRLFYGK